MIEVDLPDDDRVPEVVRSFVACLASATEQDLGSVPLPDADLGGAIAHWRSWLAGRGFGLVPIARPRRFNWPGYWLAVLDDDRAVLMFGTPSGVVLSPQDPDLVGRPSTDLPVRDGYVLSSLDARLPAVAVPAPPLRGTVAGLAIARTATGPMEAVEHARALAGRGLDGDRYAGKAGTFTPRDERLRGYDLTLVEAEALDRLVLPDGAALAHPDARRNVVTRGIDLNALVGRRFRIGEVECIGQRLCEPCSHLERLTHPGTLRALIRRGGLRADVLSDGQVAVGDPVETID